MKGFGNHLTTARLNIGFTQDQLARATGLHQSIISAIENGKRLPTIPQWLQLASVLKVPLQRFLTGTNGSGDELDDISVQLQALGIVDLEVFAERVPGAFRHNEEVMALAVAGAYPSSRIIQAMPAVLAWNAKNPHHLLVFADLANDPTIKYRLGWLADIAITIHRDQGFPGGCPCFKSLENYVRDVGLPTDEDPLGYSLAGDIGSAATRRWKMGFPSPLSEFRSRAEHLHALRAERMLRQLSMP